MPLQIRRSRRLAGLSVSSVGSEAMQQRNDERGWVCKYCLSVSSVGSEAMQPGPGGVKERLRNLSVSSVGSEAMQPKLNDHSGHHQVWLSVSSVGSEAMQRNRRAHSRPWDWGSFQYPRSDRRRCNMRMIAATCAVMLPFSILGRIGGDATAHILPLAHQPVTFQYPRSDRRRCNFAV